MRGASNTITCTSLMRMPHDVQALLNLDIGDMSYQAPFLGKHHNSDCRDWRACRMSLQECRANVTTANTSSTVTQLHFRDI